MLAGDSQGDSLALQGGSESSNADIDITVHVCQTCAGKIYMPTVKINLPRTFGQCYVLALFSDLDFDLSRSLKVQCDSVSAGVALGNFPG